MQFLRIRLENWRSVQSHEITLGAGVNIVEGANEAGKSSFIEALNVIFRERDSTKKKEIKSVTPKGNDVGSTVEVELKTGEYHLIYTKTFNKRAATSLSVLTPSLVQYTGVQAHDEVLRILDETIDVALWQAIQLEQGSEFSEVNLRQSTGLARALDNAAGGSGVGESDSAILDRARVEYLRYYTERTGRETGELADLQRRCETLTCEIETATAAMRSMQAQVDRSAMISEAIQDQTSVLPELKSAYVLLQKKQVELDSLHERKRTVNAEYDAQSLRVDECERRLKDRQMQRRQVTLRQKTLAELTTKYQTLATQSEVLQKQLVVEKLAYKQNQTRRVAVKKALQGLEAAMKYQADVQELNALETRLGRYKRTQDQLDRCRQELQQHAVDNKALETLQQLQREVRELEVRLESQQPELTLTALKDELIDDQVIHKGYSKRLDTSAAFALVVGGSARIEFKPATNLAGRQEELQRLNGQLSDLLQRLNVSDINEAVASNRQRRDLQQHSKGLQERLEELLTQNPSAAQQQLETLKMAVAAVPQSVSLADLPEQLAVRRSERDELEFVFNQLTEVVSSLQGEQSAVIAQLEGYQQRIADQQQALSENEQYLSEQCVQTTDVSLDEQLQREKARLVDCQDRLAEANSAIEQSQGKDIAQQVNNAREAMDRASLQLHQDEKEFAAVSAQLDQLRAEGLHEKLERLHAEHNDAQERLQQLTRAAGAARYLWESLVKHQRATQLRYVKPLSERVCRMGRMVFGDDFQLTLNESLTIESRTLHGLTVPFEDLSGGAREQLGIMLRLAATQLVAGVPLILDDTLGHTDAARLQTIGALLSAAGRHSQVVVMTCYPQRYRFVGDARQHRL